MMPILDDDSWGEIKGFLLFEKDERRETLHGAAMKAMLTTVADEMMPGGVVDATLRGGLRVYDTFINQPSYMGGPWWEFFEMSEWFDGLDLFNGKTTLYEDHRQMFYLDYLFKATKVMAESVTTAEAATMTETVVVADPAPSVGVQIAAAAVGAVAGAVAGMAAWDYIAPVD